MTETVGKALEQQKPSAGGLVRSYSDFLVPVLPSHVKPEMWLRLAQSALRKGKKEMAVINGQKVTGTELELAALNSPASLGAALTEAARLGLEPGTEQYYLTPRKTKGNREILGIVGYQGYIELMYRAGAISSVVVECVFRNDVFVWKPGALDTQDPPRWHGPQERPYHDIDWDAADRGTLRLVYAYAIMQSGATSKVVVLNNAAIERIKKSSMGSDTSYSPWQQHEQAMWMKSAARQLAKWVPTSAEYIREQLRAVADVAAEKEPEAPAAPAVTNVGDAWIGSDTADTADDVIDAEFEEEPAFGGPGTSSKPATQDQIAALVKLLGQHDVNERDDQLAVVSLLVNEPVPAFSNLTGDEATYLVSRIGELAAAGTFADSVKRARDMVGAK